MNSKNYINNNKKIDRKNIKKNTDYFSIAIKLILVVCLVSLCFTIYTQKKEISSLNLIYEDVEFEYNEKTEELKKLQNDLKMVDSLEFVEKQARERLKMVKANEKVFVDVNKNKE